MMLCGRVRRKQANHVPQTFLPVRLGHANYSAQGVSAGVVAWVSRQGGQDNRYMLKARRGFYMSAEMKAWQVFSLDFSDQEDRGQHIQYFARIAGIGDGDHLVPSGAEGCFGRIADTLL